MRARVPLEAVIRTRLAVLPRTQMRHRVVDLVRERHRVLHRQDEASVGLDEQWIFGWFVLQNVVRWLRWGWRRGIEAKIVCPLLSPMLWN